MIVLIDCIGLFATIPALLILWSYYFFQESLERTLVDIMMYNLYGICIASTKISEGNGLMRKSK